MWLIHSILNPWAVMMCQLFLWHPFSFQTRWVGRRSEISVRRPATVPYSRECRMQWVESLNITDDSRGGNIYIFCPKHASVTQHELLSTGRHCIYDEPKVQFIIALTTKTQQIIAVLSHMRNTTALQPNAFVTRIIYRLLVTSKKGRISPTQIIFKVNFKLLSQNQ